MTDILTLPVARVVVGQTFDASIRIDYPADDETIDLTGWTLAWAFSERPFDEGFATGTGTIVTASDGDHATFSVPSATTALWSEYALPRIAGRPAGAMLQIVLTHPSGSPEIPMQGQAIFQGTI